jgi:hypothetical protein
VRADAEAPKLHRAEADARHLCTWWDYTVRDGVGSRPVHSDRCHEPQEAVDAKRPSRALLRRMRCGQSIDRETRKPLNRLERARRIERPTLTLARLCSTPELRPRSRRMGVMAQGGRPGQAVAFQGQTSPFARA